MRDGEVFMTEKLDNEIPKEIRFNYLKSAHFRVAHVDGVIGNITPKRQIFFAFYNERVSLPDFLVHNVKEDGSLGNIAKSETTSPGLVREMDMGFVIDIETAKSLSVWFSSMISQAESLEKKLRIEIANGDFNGE